MISGIDVLRLTELLPDLPGARTRLLDNLGRIRREVGPLTPELSDALADHMNIRRGEVHEVISFYSFLQVPVDAVRAPDKVRVLTVSGILAETIHNVFADDSVSAIFAGENQLF